MTTILLTLTYFLIWGNLNRAFFTFAGIAVGVGLLVGVAFGVGFKVELAVTISDDFSKAIGEAAWLELPNAIARKAERKRSVPNAIFILDFATKSNRDIRGIQSVYSHQGVVITGA